MSPTIHDLRSTLEAVADERAAIGVDRLDGVRRHVRRRRTARAGVSALTAAVVVGGAVSALGSLQRHPSLKPPASSTSHALPDYQYGGRLAGTLALTGRAGEVRSITITPTNWDLTFVGNCDQTPAAEPQLELSINGHAFMWGGVCGGASSGGELNPAQKWRGLGVQLGKPSTVTLRVTGAKPESGSSSPIGSTHAVSGRTSVRVGIYQGVPWAQYPFPERPDVVRRPVEASGPLNGPRLGGQVRVPMPATGSSQTTIAYHRDLIVQGLAWAPGQVDVLVNGRVINRSSTWTYDPTGWEVGLSPDVLTQAKVPVPREGDPITVRFQATRFLDPAVEIRLGQRRS